MHLTLLNYKTKMLIILISFFSFLLASDSKDLTFNEMPKGFRIAWEIELTKNSLSNIVHDFDFETLQQEFGESINKKLVPHFYDSYLANSPEALSSFPPEIQLKLTKGLELKNDFLYIPKAPSNKNVLGFEPLPTTSPTQRIYLPSEQRLLTPQGLPSPTPSKPSLIILPQNLSAPSQEKAPDHFQQKGSLELPTVHDWQVLHKRWESLDFETKKSLVKWVSLSRPKRAVIAIYHGNSKLKTKEGLSKKKKELYKKLEWIKDQDTLEFRYKDNVHVSNLSEFYDDLKLFSMQAGIDQQILFRKKSNLKSSSFHIHVSLKNRDIRPHARLLNHYLFLREVKSGVIDNLLNSSKVNQYSPSAEGRGIIRIISPEHFEIRAGHEILRDDIKLIGELITLGEDEAQKLMRQKISLLLSDPVVERIALLNSQHLSSVSDFLSPKQKEKHAQTFQDLDWLKSLKGEIPQNFSERSLRILKSQDTYAHNEVMKTLSRQASWQPEVWRLIPLLIQSPNIDLRNSLFPALHSKKPWPENFWKEVIVLLKTSDKESKKYILSLITKYSEWPKEIWKEFPALLNSTHIDVIDASAYALEKQRGWTNDIHIRAPLLLKSPNTHTIISILKGLELQTQWTRETKSGVEKLLEENLAPTIQRVAVRTISSRGKWSDVIWKRILLLLNEPTTDPSVLATIIHHVKDQSPWKKEAWDKAPLFLTERSYFIKIHMIRALLNQEVWPASVWDKIPYLFKLPEQEAQISLFEALNKQKAWPISFWKEIPSLLSSSSFNTSSLTLKLLQKRRVWSPETWKTIASLIKGTKNNSSNILLLLEALETQSSWPEEVLEEVLKITRTSTDPKVVSVIKELEKNYLLNQKNCSSFQDLTNILKQLTLP